MVLFRGSVSTPYVGTLGLERGEGCNPEFKVTLQIPMFVGLVSSLYVSRHKDKGFPF